MTSFQVGDRVQEKANRSAFEDSIEYRSNLHVDEHGHSLSTVIDRNLLFLVLHHP